MMLSGGIELVWMPLGATMQFHVLGPLAVHDGIHDLPLGAPKVHVLLALLLCRAGEVVPVGALLDGLWGSQPPRTANKNLQLYVHQLRKALGDARRVELRRPGYVLLVHPGELDAERFEALASQARLAYERADFLTASGLSRQALALWQGMPFSGLVDDVSVLEAEAERLQERKLVVLAQRIEADLQLGRHHDVVPELTELAAQHPLRERFHAQLMLALYRSRRQAEALEVYRKARSLLARELGLEPSTELSDLAQAILRTDPQLDVVARGSRSPVPAQLPAGLATFTGRDEHLRELSREELRIVVITGTAGVGKTALALHWGHRVLDRFPDGQLYVNLHGYAPTAAMTAGDALAGFLHALDVPPDRVPVELDGQMALYRSTIVGKRMLIVLDNAASVDQVRPLFPGRPGSLVLITSRDELRGLAALNDATVLRLGVLTPEEAMLLLERIVGPERVDAERQAATELVRLCACLPLALRIAAANLTGSIEECVTRLRESDRLDRLSVAGDPAAAVRVTFELSYSTLQPAVRRVFRLLGLVPGPDFTAQAAVALAGVDHLAELVKAHLVDVDTTGRHHFHDLLRLYAAERALAEDTAAEREQARGRLFDWYLTTAAAATSRLAPHVLRLTEPSADVHFADDASALAWLEAERANLVAAVREAAERGPLEVAWLLADVLRGYFWQRRYSADWLSVAQAGLTAATADDAIRGRIAAEQSLAQAHRSLGHYTVAITHYTSALELAEQAGWAEAQAAAHGNVAGVYWELGRLDEAAAELRQAIRLNRQSGWQSGLAANLSNLGTLYRELGRPQEAAEHLAQALEVHEQLGSKSGAAHARSNMGEVFFDLGRLADAERILHQGLLLHRDTGGRYGETTTRNCLTAVYAEMGEPGKAAEHGRAALDLARETGDRRTEAVSLAALAHLGEADSVTLAEQALHLAREINYPRAETDALLALAGACHRRGRCADALANAKAALDMATRHSFHLLAGNAQMIMAAVHLDLGRYELAREHAQLALDIHCRTGNRIGEGRALGLLGRAAHHLDGPAEARTLILQALDVLAGCGSVEQERLTALIDG
jgi:DNA-binding SARP family transcriptional activator/Tfp pilus assembly protein PilF